MKQLIERVTGSRPVRAWQRYSQTNGPVLAQGMTLQAFLSLFAALFVAFAVFMAVLGDNVALRTTVIDSLSRSIPGLIGRPGDPGAIDVDSLTGSSIVGWAGAIAAVSILFTAIAWLSVSREGFRAMFELDDPTGNFLLLKLGDLGVAVGIGLLVLVSAGVQVVATALVEALGFGWAATLVGIGIQLVLDTSTVLLLYRFAGRLRLPVQQVLPAAFACAVAFFALKQVATLLFAGVEKNPLLASVAATVIILIWLGFIMQILLLVLAFVAVGPTGRAYTRLVHSGGIDARLTPERARELLDELHASRGDGDDSVKLHKRLAKRNR